MTSGSHAPAPDRVAEAAGKFDFRYIVKPAGDEPCTPPDLLAAFAATLDKLDDNSLLTCVSNATMKDKENPNVVKSCAAANARRCTFRVRRYRTTGTPGTVANKREYWSLGNVRVHRAIAERFCFFGGTLEMRESSNSCGRLKNGMRIVCHMTEYAYGCGIDTPEDLDAFRKRVEGPV